MVGYWVLLMGVFLTPAALVRIIPGVGFSVGDAFLVSGACLVVLEHAARQRLTSQPRPPARPVSAFGLPFVAAGTLIILGVLLSGLVRQQAGGFDIASLVLQYATILVLLPVAFLLLTQEQLDRAVVAFLAGFTTMVIVGVVLVTQVPSLAGVLIEAGWMKVLAGDRHGLFVGVGELSKVAAITLPFTYYLAISGRIGRLRALAFTVPALLAIVVSRSASGVAMTIAVIVALAGLHVVARRRQREGPGLVKAVFGVGAAVAVAWFLVGRVGDGSFLQGFKERLVEPFTQGGVGAVGSATLRENLVAEGWTYIGQRPLFGAGPGLYHETVSSSGQGVHVVPVMIWAETGLLPLLGWGVLLVGVAVPILRSWRRAPLVAAAAAAVWASTLVWHMAAPYMYPRIMGLPLLLAYLIARQVQQGGRGTVGGDASQMTSVDTIDDAGKHPQRV